MLLDTSTDIRLPAPTTGGATARPPSDSARLSLDARVSSLWHLGLTLRARNALLRDGIQTVEEILCRTEHELEALPSMWWKPLMEIREFLKERGRRIGELAEQ